MTADLDAFLRDGYLVLPDVFTSSEIDHFRQLRQAATRDWCFVNGQADEPIVVGDLLERHPRTMLEVVTHPSILGLAESIMGPFVQLDSVVLHASPPSPEHSRGQVVCWHRDRFGSFPAGLYTRPLALIYFVYLQDMNAETGPLRVIPGSHRQPIEITPADLARARDDEVLVTTVPGDVIVIHNNLLHSGTRSVANVGRQFLGLSYTLSCLGSRCDSFDGPNCRALLATACRMHDRRLMRLLGWDEQIDARQNTGFTMPPAADWEQWRTEDDAYAREAEVVRRQVTEVWKRLV
jgi:hypothetical protein